MIIIATFVAIICLVVFISIISCVLGAPMPTYFQLVMSSVSLFNFLKAKKEETSMKKITMTAVGLVRQSGSKSLQEIYTSVTKYTMKAPGVRIPDLPL